MLEIDSVDFSCYPDLETYVKSLPPNHVFIKEKLDYIYKKLDLELVEKYEASKNKFGKVRPAFTVKIRCSIIQICAYFGLYDHLVELNHAMNHKRLALESMESLIAKNQYLAIRLAVENGHLNVINFFESFFSKNDQFRMITGHDFILLKSAVKGSHKKVLEHYFSNISALNFFENHTSEVENIHFDLYVRSRLACMLLVKITYERLHPNQVFNIERDEVEFYFIVLRYLIRQNKSTDNDNIRLLLNLPSLRNRVDCGFVDLNTWVDVPLCMRLKNEPSTENELLKVALAVENTVATRLLLNFHSVRKLANASGLHIQANSLLELHDIAQDKESSMRALSLGQKLTFKTLKEHYSSTLMAKGGIEAVFNLLISDLEKLYEKKPAKLYRNAQEYKLPLSFSALQELKMQLQLSVDANDTVLQLYHQHVEHTAWRYLSKPNQWMDPSASYVFISDDGTKRWSAFEYYKPEIVYFYLAAIDEDMPCTDQSTIEDRFNLFVKQLALIGRAHNWDEKNEDGSEFDDITQGDKPACYSGVPKRLYQAVLNHPLIVPIEALLNQEINNFVRDSFHEKLLLLSEYQINQLKEDIDKAFVCLTADGQYFKTIQYFNVSKAIQDKFIGDMCEKWGEEVRDYIKQLVKSRFSFCELFSTHLAKFYSETCFHKLLNDMKGRDKLFDNCSISPSPKEIELFTNEEFYQTSWLEFFFPYMESSSQIQLLSLAVVILGTIVFLCGGSLAISVVGIVTASVGAFGFVHNFFSPSTLDLGSNHEVDKQYFVSSF